MSNPTRTYSMYVDARNGVAGMSIGNEKIEDHTGIGGKTQINQGTWTHIAISYDEKEKKQRLYN